MLPQMLLIDADDTLWENNVYFDQAIAGFIERLNHQRLSPAEVKAFLYDVERETVLERGYGSHSFAHSLVKCFERLSDRPVTPELHEFIWGFAHKVSNYPIELISGVPETLDYLARRGHHMVVMTKGNFTEQSGKVERSGIKEYFAAVEIVAEKMLLVIRTWWPSTSSSRRAHGWSATAPSQTSIQLWPPASTPSLCRMT